jgi:hypothetical protein
MVDQSTLPNSPTFFEMDNIIHIDEKWFNATKKSAKFYMLPEEDRRTHTGQFKIKIQLIN